MNHTRDEAWKRCVLPKIVLNGKKMRQKRKWLGGKRVRSAGSLVGIRARVGVWLELLRLPNLFTVPGDVLVGWVLAGMRGGFPWAGVAASLCLYSAGLLLNDCLDVHIDRCERPQRPIPSGRITRGRVLIVAMVLSGCGLVLSGSGIEIAGLLLALIVCYDGGIKRIPGLGVLVMGACRGVNVWLGAAVSYPVGQAPFSARLGAAMMFLAGYILLVSIVARHEAERQAWVSPLWRCFPVLMTLAWIPLVWLLGYGWHGEAVFAAAALIPVVIGCRAVPSLVAGLIRHLILLQALWCVIALPLGWVEIWMGGFVVCWGLAMLAGMRIAGS